MVENIYLRQLDLLDPSKISDTIEIIGCGSVGSFTALNLDKMGLKLKIWDQDTVEEHNISNQFFDEIDIGRTKVDAVLSKLQVSGQSGETSHITKDDLDKLEGDIIITAVDNMETRKMVFEYMKNNPKFKFLIDPRMGGEVMRIYTINVCNPEDIKMYENSLRGEAREEPCTARSILYNVLVIAGLVSGQVKKCVLNEDYKREVIFDLKNLIFSSI